MNIRNRGRGDREKVEEMYSVSGIRKECDKVIEKRRKKKLARGKYNERMAGNIGVKKKG